MKDSWILVGVGVMYALFSIAYSYATNQWTYLILTAIAGVVLFEGNRRLKKIDLEIRRHESSRKA